jgi:tetratricopeptide (TPR) repeat protein
LQYRPGVTSTVAILALVALAPPLALTRSAERVPLPVPAAELTLHIRPFERKLVLEVPARTVAALARRLKGASRLCPEVEAGASSVTLRCSTNKLRADLDLTTAEPTLDLRELTIYPWRPEEEGPPFVLLDLPGLGLSPCPGATPDARGECLLAEGRLEEALEQFAEAARGPRFSPLAALRLGDLALASDEPELAMEHWRRANHEFPFGRLVMARLCEMDPRCLKGEERKALLDASRVAEPVRHDVFIRALRLRLLEGETAAVVRALAPEMTPEGACAGSTMMAWCRRLLLDLLRTRGPDGAEALAIFLDLPGRDQGPLSAELLRAAADQAEASGAPVFAANMLAAMTGRVPEADQPAHLRRVAGLFLQGGDRARAEEIVLFARGHLDRATWRRDGWDALQRSARQPPPARPPAPPADPDLEAARTVVESARLLQLSQGARP